MKGLRATNQGVTAPGKQVTARHQGITTTREGSRATKGLRGLAVGWMVALALVLGAAGAAAEAAGQGSAPSKIADVPPNHWAYQAVATLVERGYITLEGNRFDGSRPVDRFTLASVVARLLNDLEQGRTQLSPEELQLLRRLTGEFREELARWQNDRAQLVTRLEEQAQNVVRVDRKLTELLDAWDRQSRAQATQLGALEKRTGELEQRAGELDRRVERLEQSSAAGLAQAVRTAEGLREVVTQLQQQVDTLSRQTRRLDIHEQQLQTLQQAQADQQQAIQGLQQLSSGHQDRLQALQQTTEAQQQGLESLRQQLAGLGAQAEQLSGRIQSLDQQLAQLAASGSEQAQALRGELASLRQQLGQLNGQMADLQQRLTEQATALDARVQRLESQGQTLARTAAAAELRDLLGRMGLEAAGQQELAREVNRLKEQNRLLTWAAVGGLVLAVIALATRR